MIQRIELFFEYDFFEYDSMNRTFFNMTRRLDFFFFWVFLKKRMTQRIELFSKIRYKELNFFSIWLNFFSKYDSKNLTLHFTMTQRLCFFFWKKSKNLTFMTHRLEPFFFFWIFFQKKKRLKELSPFFFELWLSKCFFFFEVRMRLTELIFFFCNTTHRIDLFFFWIWLFFLTLNFFFEFDSKNWNLQYDSEE